MRREFPQISFRQPENNPLKALAASRRISFTGINQKHAQMLEMSLAKAEVGLCDYSTKISVDPTLGTDFHVSRDKTILGPHAFSSAPILRLHLRHAIELTLWFQL